MQTIIKFRFVSYFFSGYCLATLFKMIGINGVTMIDFLLFWIIVLLIAKYTEKQESEWTKQDIEKDPWNYYHYNDSSSNS
jgi:hypothetical protein